MFKFFKSVLKKKNSVDGVKVKQLCFKTAYLYNNEESVVLISQTGEYLFVNTNYLKHVMGVPYINKNGDLVTSDEIEAHHVRFKKRSS